MKNIFLTLLILSASSAVSALELTDLKVDWSKTKSVDLWMDVTVPEKDSHGNVWDLTAWGTYKAPELDVYTRVPGTEIYHLSEKT